MAALRNGNGITIAILEKVGKKQNAEPDEMESQEEGQEDEEMGALSAAEELIEAIGEDAAAAVLKSIRYIHDSLHAEKYYNDGPYGERGGDKESPNPGKTRPGGNPRPEKKGEYS